MENTLEKYRQEWQRKPVLRAIYHDYYQRIIRACNPGISLEIGGGSGNLKSYVSDVISTDIIPSPWLDAAADAQALPFASGSFANIVAVDVLHHIESPRNFFAEADRALKPNGRVILIEPAITPVSWVFYKLFHPEPVILNINPLEEGMKTDNRDPFDANQAIPTLLFNRYRQQLKHTFPRFNLTHLEYLSLFAYPLSGGFRPWSLIPTFFVNSILKVENVLAPIVGRLAAFRLFAVLQKV